jgi:hypothetical protein
MQTVIQDYFNGLCCTEIPPVTYNFDVDSSDWAGAGITNKATFESVLGVTTDQFLLAGNNIQANILTGGYYLILNNRNITNVNYITYNGIYHLGITNNPMITFNPTLPLHNNLSHLHLNGNQIVTFNPSIPLPNSLATLNLEGNQMTTVGYTASEPWANTLHTAPSGGEVIFNLNTNSVSGTNLETILALKGWTVNV